MKSILYPAVLGLFFSLLLIPGMTYAHELKVGDHIGAVLHTEPNDEPIAGTTTPLYLAFKNNGEPFIFSAYTIHTTITAESDHRAVSIPSADLQATSPDTVTFSYIFPKKDLYTLTITGEPADASSSDPVIPFSLSYDIRVDRVATGKNAYQSFLQIHSLHAIIVLIGIGIGTVITVRDERKRRMSL
jgi:hypothetical protein